MPADCRPDITLRKVWGNIEKQRINKNIGYPKLAKAMHISLKGIYNRRNNPETLKCSEVIYAARFFDVDIEEMFR